MFNIGSLIPPATPFCSYYVNKVAEEGLLAFAMATSPEFVAPFGAKQPVFGTNPIACAIPRPGQPPLVIDLATSAYTLFGLLEAKTAGVKIPDNVAYNSQVPLPGPPLPPLPLFQAPPQVPTWATLTSAGNTAAHACRVCPPMTPPRRYPAQAAPSACLTGAAPLIAPPPSPPHTPNTPVRGGEGVQVPVHCSQTPLYEVLSSGGHYIFL